MKLEHAALGVAVELKDELLQKDVEGYFSALREIGGETFMDQSAPERLGNFLRAGCRVGILNTIHEEDVDSLKPAATAWIAQKLDAHIAEALTIPPE